MNNKIIDHIDQHIQALRIPPMTPISQEEQDYKDALIKQYELEEKQGYLPDECKPFVV